MRAALVLILLLLAPSALAGDAALSQREAAAARGFGGLGLQPCHDLAGAGNTPLLAQAGDWMLGYMAGRIDAGDHLLPGAAAVASSPIDLLLAVATFCSADPDATLLAAARAYGKRVFGTEPLNRSFEGAPPAVPRPRARPAGMP